MADGKIYITISDTRGGSGAGLGNGSEKEKDKSSLLDDYIKHEFFNMIKSEAKSIANYTIGNIGNFTGNYQTQRDIQTNISNLSRIISSGIAIGAATAKYGPYAGAAVGITMAIAEGTSIGMKTYSDWFETRKTNRNIEIMRNRLGLEGLTNGGRTGNY